MEEFNKKLKVDRVNQFGHLVKAMAHGTPTEGYAIGDAIKALPDNLQQYLLSEVPDRILRKEHTRRGLNDLTTTPYEGIDELRETYTDEVFKRDPAKELCNLLGIKSKFPRYPGCNRRSTETVSGTVHTERPCKRIVYGRDRNEIITIKNILTWIIRLEIICV